jgi:GT2 family glycosyltransferase
LPARIRRQALLAGRQAKRPGESELLDVIVPVFGGLAQTRRCLESVMAAGVRTPFAIVVVDDASPIPEIGAWLDELAAVGRITLVRNAGNEGFVRSVNRGMAMHADRDAVLLNSDTEVANDWLDRLRRAAYSAPDVGTVTPFSNNATICSYPFEGWPDGTPGTLGLAALDRVFAAANDGRTQDLPTAVGFCMYIRRACLDAVGPFDAERFGRGYGEENDFCLRAAKAGWRSVLAADVFVFHEGAVSFSSERAALTEVATRTILELHPDYLERVHAFIRRDPAHGLREAVDAARAGCGAAEARRVLAERATERMRLVAQLREIESLATDREAARAALALELDRCRDERRQAERVRVEREGELETAREGRARRWLRYVTRLRR